MVGNKVTSSKELAISKSSPISVFCSNKSVPISIKITIIANKIA